MRMRGTMRPLTIRPKEWKQKERLFYVIMLHNHVDYIIFQVFKEVATCDDLPTSNFMPFFKPAGSVSSKETRKLRGCSGFR